MCGNATSRRKLAGWTSPVTGSSARVGAHNGMDYTVYILACADGTYYTGIARDADRRAGEHNGFTGKGARYTASRRPVQIVYQAVFASRSDAQREEIRIKRLTRTQKEALIAQLAETLADVAL